MNKNLRSGSVKKIFRNFLVVVCCAFITSFVNAQIKFSAICPERKIGKNDYLQVQFSLENATNVETIIPPSFKNFIIVSGPNQQSGMSNINGSIKQYIAVEFILKPRSAGNFTILPATAKADGKEFRSAPVSIEVTNSSSLGKTGGSSFSSPFSGFNLDPDPQPQPVHEFDDYILHKGENIGEKIRKNLFIKVNVNKKSCYIGEPVVATYKLYTRLRSESNLIKTPSFNGFSVSELMMPGNNNLTTEKYNGREYQVYTLRKVLLYPLQSGTFVLEPIEAENRVTFINGDYAGSRRGDVFYDMLRDFANENSPQDAMQQQTINLKSEPVSVIVKPFPDANKPADFKGAAGEFKIVAGLQNENISTDDAGNLKLIIGGAGNIQLVNAPAIAWPQGLEGYDPKGSENIDKLSVPMKGEKIFSYSFTAAKEGDYQIPEIKFSYFDLNAGSYKTISTQPLMVHVKKGNGVLKSKSNNISEENKNDNNGIATWVKNNWEIMGSGLLIFAALIFLVTRKSNQKNKIVAVDEVQNMETENKVEEAPQFVIPVNPLADAEKKLNENHTTQFYRSLDTCFKKYLSDKLEIPLENLTKKKINERMDKCNVGVGTTILVAELLQNIELNLYAPFSTTDQMQSDFEKASEIVSLLDKQLC
jgi:hypothetical protein